MRIALLLLVFSCIFAGEATQPLPNVAKQVSDVLQARYEATRKADLAATKELKKLFIKYRDVVKNQRPTLIAISIALNKIDPNDGEVILVLKDVPADQRDLLGDSTEPGKYLTEVQAKFIADALVKGKFTGKDWDALPGKVITLNPAVEASPTLCSKGQTIIAVPHPEDKWRQNKNAPMVNWLGGVEKTMELTLKIVSTKEQEAPTLLRLGDAPIKKLPCDGSFVLTSFIGPDALHRTGSIRVKVYEVVPVE